MAARSPAPLGKVGRIRFVYQRSTTAAVLQRDRHGGIALRFSCSSTLAREAGRRLLSELARIQTSRGKSRAPALPPCGQRRSAASRRPVMPAAAFGMRCPLPIGLQPRLRRATLAASGSMISGVFSNAVRRCASASSRKRGLLFAGQTIAVGIVGQFAAFLVARISGPCRARDRSRALPARRLRAAAASRSSISRRAAAAALSSRTPRPNTMPQAIVSGRRQSRRGRR